MLNIPENVPQDLVQELEECQAQLKILLGNYKVNLHMCVLYCSSDMQSTLLSTLLADSEAEAKIKSGGKIEHEILGMDFIAT